MRITHLFLWRGMLFFLMPGALAVGQATPSPAPVNAPAPQPAAPTQTTLPATLQNLRQQQQALALQWQALMAQGATPQQVQAWQQQNAPALQNLQQLANSLAAAAPSHPLAYVTDVDLPPGATPQMSDFLATKADLANRFAELYNQQLQAGSGSAAAVNAAAQYQQQNAAEIQTQQQQAQVIAAQAAAQPVPLPPASPIPAGAGPRFRAYLTLRDQLMREQMQLYNQYAGGNSAARDAALRQWHQANTARFLQLQQMAQTIATIQN